MSEEDMPLRMASPPAHPINQGLNSPYDLPKRQPGATLSRNAVLGQALQDALDRPLQPQPQPNINEEALLTAIEPTNKNAFLEFKRDIGVHMDDESFRTMRYALEEYANQIETGLAVSPPTTSQDLEPMEHEERANAYFILNRVHQLLEVYKRLMVKHNLDL